MKVLGEEGLIKLISLIENRYATGTASSSSEDISSQLASYATLASPSLTGTPEAPTAEAGTNTEQIATTAFVQTAVSNLVNSAPETLDTLNELAAALGNDSNFATTISNQIGNKINAGSADYIKSAAVNNNTLTLTKGDNTTVVFTAEQVSDYVTQSEMESFISEEIAKIANADDIQF